MQAAKAGINLSEVGTSLGEFVRISYGRHLALPATPTGDIPAAEDAIADAMERALIRWSIDGIPANPEGWILTAAPNRPRDRWKSHAYHMTEPMLEIDLSATELGEALVVIPDRRLELMLVCAHPAVAANCQTPLLLQTFFGVYAAAIARAFSVAATLPQRLCAPNAESVTREYRLLCRNVQIWTSGCPPFWKRSTARSRSTGNFNRTASRSIRCPPRRCIWPWSWPKYCPTIPRCSDWPH